MKSKVKSSKKKIEKKGIDKSSIFLIVILFIGFFVRLIFLLQLEKTPFYINLFSDSKIYYELAQQFVKESWSLNNAYFMAPIYSYFIAVIIKIFGSSLFYISFIQIIISVSSIYLVYLISKKVFDEKIALIASFIMAFYKEFIFYSGLLLSETFQIFFVLLLIYFLVKFRFDLDSYKEWIITGLTFGIVILFKANFLLFIFPLLAYFYFTRDKKTPKVNFIKRSIILVGFTILPVLPFTIHNIVVANDFVFYSANGGINFYIGNNKNSIGVYQTPAEFDFYFDMSGKSYAESIVGRKMKLSEVSDYWYSKGFEYIKSQPFDYIQLMFKKLLFFIHYDEYPQSSVMDSDFYGEEFGTIMKLPFINYIFISILGLAGLIYCIYQKKGNWLLIIIFFTYLFSTCLFFVNGRFRLAIVPVVIIFASFLIFELYNLIKNKNYSELSKPTILIIIVVIFNFIIPKVNISNYDGYLNLGNSYFDNKEYNKAIDYINKSLKLKKTDLGFMTIGNIYATLGEREKSLNAYREAININPKNYLVYFNIGSLFTQEKEYEKALENYSISVKLNPYFADSYKNMAIIYYIFEDYPKSLEYFENYIKYSNDEETKKTVYRDIEDIKQKLTNKK